MLQIKSCNQQNSEIITNRVIEPENTMKDESKSIEKPASKPKTSKSAKLIRQTWNLTQEKRYVRFLKSKQSLFDLPLAEKRKARVNIQMSKIVKTKNSIQCHSHHQKMVKKHGSIEDVIKKMQHLLQLPSAINPAFVRKPRLKVQHEGQAVNMLGLVNMDYHMSSIMKEESQSAEIYIRYFPQQNRSIKIEEHS